LNAKARLLTGAAAHKLSAQREGGGKLYPSEFVPGMTVGHWQVLGDPRPGKNGSIVPCVSQCGTLATVSASELRTGRPLTCEACRPGMAAPQQRVVCEPVTKLLKKGWERLMGVEVLSTNVLTNGGSKAWDEYGAGMLDRLVARTKWGAGFGWKVLLKDQHVHAKTRPAERRVLIRLRPAKSEYWFDAYLGWVRTDVPAETVAEAVKAACVEDQPAEAEPPAPPAAAAPALPADAGPMNIARLEKMRDGIGRLIDLNRDMDAIAKLKAEAADRVRVAEAAERGPRGEAERAAERLAVLTDERAALRAQLADLNEKVRKTSAALSDVDGQYAAADHERAVTATRHEPLRVALADAKTQLAEVEASERERASAAAQAKDVAALLAALERMG
jgi:hypothetical protein